MPATTENMIDVAKAIQLALGPVFLLTGVSGMLNVMSGRLSRIVDRGRALTEGRVNTASMDKNAINLQLQTLERRRHFASTAITACAIAALLVCLVIVVLFAEVMLEVPLKWLIGGLFTAATLALIVGLTFFLREVHMAAQTVRISFSETI